MKKIPLILLFLVSVLSCSLEKSGEKDYRPLFNGQDLTGWETYIGVPRSDIPVEGLLRDSLGQYAEAIGLNRDPLAVFSVVSEDGEPAIRASGQVNGSLATLEEFGNYHLRLEVKWGEKKWSGNPEELRNSGLLFHGTGEFGKGLGVWKSSHECQLMETMFGDSYRMGDTFCRIAASRPENSDRFVYDPEAVPVEVGEGREAGKIVSKNTMAEKPHGEWNRIELICFEDTAIHIINGKVNMMLTGSHLEKNGSSVPLVKGVIQLQSEGSEVFFRKIEIRKIEEIPGEYL